MADRRELTITVFDHSYSEWSGTLRDFVAEMQGHLDAIPCEFKDDAWVTVEIDHGFYDSGANLTFNCSYRRMETDEEMAARLAQEDGERAAYQRRQTAHELATLAALKAKYGEA